MATKNDTSKATPESVVAPSPSKKNWKIVIAFLLCFIISVTASIGGTYFIMPKEIKPIVTNEDDGQAKQLIAMKEAIAAQDKTIKEIQTENNTLKLYLRHSSSTALKNILIDQENNIQAYLKVMKAAMEDLTKLTSGTRDWNNKYQYQLDLALKGSLEREDLLKLLKTGEPNDK